jgi:hypothetical protein
MKLNILFKFIKISLSDHQVRGRKISIISGTIRGLEQWYYPQLWKAYKQYGQR